MQTTLTTLITSIVLALGTARATAGDGCTPWSATPGQPGMSDGNVADLLAWDDGSGGGPQLYATGSFGTAGGVAGTARIARWTGSGWAALGTGLSNQFSIALAIFDGDLFVGGYFDSAGGVPGTAKLARWTGASWSSPGGQLDQFDDAVWSLASFDDGSGEALYVGGNYKDIGGTTVDYLARYDGSAYEAIGGGTIGGPGIPLIVFDLETWDDGGGPALYAGGRFTSVAGVPANRIAKWDGMQWSALGSGISGTTAVGTGVYAMEPWDDGSGPSLFVAGQAITSAGGVSVSRIARWDGAQWHDVGGGVDGTVWDLRIFDDGTGEALYAVGLFTTAGGTAATRIARWDGRDWTAVGSGVGANDSVFCATPFDDGSGPALFIGGSFTSIEGASANRVARYDGCPTGSVPGDVDGDGDVDADDLVQVILDWGACPSPPAGCPSDIVPPGGDGLVNVDDLLAVILNWS